MTEFIDLMKSSLKIIEKLKANLPDDTYLDKFISGLREKFQPLSFDILEEKIKKIELEPFCERNFQSDNYELRNFTFRLCSLMCEKSEKWICKCATFLQKFKIWPVSHSLFELLRFLIQEDKVDIKVVWKQLLAQVVLGKTHDKSYFWKD